MPESEAMLMIRPSPAVRMEVNAARRHRNEPGRVAPSVSCQMSHVVSPNGADVSTPAAQTRAAIRPVCAAAANSRSTSSTLLTSVGTGVAWPPAARMPLATLARASRSRAASTTCAPAPARASAVAAPIPRLAPVTIATRPASQCPRSLIDCRSCTPADGSPVELFVSIQTPFQVEMLFGMLAARRARDLGRPPDAICGRLDLIWRDQEAGYAVHDYLAESTPFVRHDRSPARLSVRGSHAERLVPPCRADNDRCAGHCRPHRGSRHSLMHRHAWRITPGVDLFSCVLGVVDVAIDVDPGPGRLSDVDRLGGSLLGTQPACENSAVPGRLRPGDGTRRHIWREDRVDSADPAPGARLECGHAGHGRRQTAPGCLTKRCRDRRVRWQVKRVHDGHVQPCSETNRRGVEGVIVDNVIPGLPDNRVGPGKGRRGRDRVAVRWSGSSVHGGCQRSRIDPGIDDRGPWYLRTRGGVDMYLVTSADQAARKVGHEGLRASALRFADG